MTGRQAGGLGRHGQRRVPPELAPATHRLTQRLADPARGAAPAVSRQQIASATETNATSQRVVSWEHMAKHCNHLNRLSVRGQIISDNVSKSAGYLRAGFTDVDGCLWLLEEWRPKTGQCD